MQKRLFASAIVALFLCNISPIQAAQVLFTPAIVVSEQYTDNLFLDNQNEEEDYITAAGLDLSGYPGAQAQHSRHQDDQADEHELLGQAQALEERLNPCDPVHTPIIQDVFLAGLGQRSQSDRTKVLTTLALW